MSKRNSKNKGATELSWHLLDMHRQWTAHGDAKAVAVVAVVGVAFGGVFAVVAGRDVETWWQWALLALVLVSGGMALTFGLSALRARVDRDAQDKNVLFFGDIATHYAEAGDEKRLRDALHQIARDQAELEGALANQLRMTALVAHAKFRRVNRAIFTLYFSLPLMLLLTGSLLLAEPPASPPCQTQCVQSQP